MESLPVYGLCHVLPLFEIYTTICAISGCVILRIYYVCHLGCFNSCHFLGNMWMFNHWDFVVSLLLGVSRNLCKYKECLLFSTVVESIRICASIEYFASCFCQEYLEICTIVGTIWNMSL